MCFLRFLNECFFSRFYSLFQEMQSKVTTNLKCVSQKKPMLLSQLQIIINYNNLANYASFLYALLDTWFWVVNSRVIVNMRTFKILCRVLRLKMWKSVRIEIYWNVRRDEFWSKHLVSTCSKMYPMYVYANLVVTSDNN